jgi:hypothetical protein
MASPTNNPNQSQEISQIRRWQQDHSPANITRTRVSHHESEFETQGAASPPQATSVTFVVAQRIMAHAMPAESGISADNVHPGPRAELSPLLTQFQHSTARVQHEHAMSLPAQAKTLQHYRNNLLLHFISRVAARAKLLTPEQPYSAGTASFPLPGPSQLAAGLLASNLLQSVTAMASSSESICSCLREFASWCCAATVLGLVCTACTVCFSGFLQAGGRSIVFVSPLLGQAAMLADMRHINIKGLRAGHAQTRKQKQSFD